MPAENSTILEGKIFPPLIRFTIPLLLAILLQALYGAVDLVIVGKFCSTSSVAAVSNGSQVMYTVTGIITGLTMGVTVIVGQFIGARDYGGASRTVGATTKLFAVFALILTAALYFLSAPITRGLDVPEEAVVKTVSYLKICSLGMVFIVAFNAISGLFRGVGDSKSPLIFIAIACGVNIAGDLLLVGWLKLDAAGAAIATVFAQAVSVAFSVAKIKRGGLNFDVTKEDFRATGLTERMILKVGAPISIEDGLVSFSFLVIMGIVNSLGLAASASLGIAEKLFLFLSIVPMSFMSGLSAFVAQNIGARQEERALKSMWIAMAISFCFGVCMFLLTFFAGDFLARIFTDDAEVIEDARLYLKGVSGEYVLLPITFCFLGYFNGIGRTHLVLAEGLVSAFLVRIPLSYLFSRMPDTNMFKIALAVPAAAVVSLIMCVFFFLFEKKRRAKLKI